MTTAIETAPPPTDEDQVWRALADPTRRRLLDLLRERPRTTGDLAAHFTMTRFGVMKHLRALQDAGLVLVQRRGRERWNHLNPVPIRRIHDRWVARHVARAAGAMSRLKDHVETRNAKKGGKKPR